MPFELFPARMQSVRASHNEPLLRAFRFIAVVYLLLDLALLFITKNAGLLSLTTWYVCLALLFEIFAVLSYFIQSLDKVACLLFVVAWPIVATIGIYFYYLSILLSHVSVSNFGPIILLLVDYLLNRIDIIRIHYAFMILIFLPNVLFGVDSIEILEKLMSVVHFYRNS